MLASLVCIETPQYSLSKREETISIKLITVTKLTTIRIPKLFTPQVIGHNLTP